MLRSIALPLFTSVVLAPLAAAQNYERVSVRNNGSQLAKGAYQEFAVSGSGRFVAFVAEDDDVTGSGAPHAAVFLRDRVQQKTMRISMATGGGAANGASYSPSISRDGRFVAFLSDATDLGPTDSDTLTDVYLRDRVAGTTVLVTAPSWYSAPERPLVSADGTHVVFTESQSTETYEVASDSILGSTGFFMTTTSLSADASVAIGGAWPVSIVEIAWPLLSTRSDFYDSDGHILAFPSEPVIAADGSAIFVSAERWLQPYPNYGKWYSTYWYSGYGGGIGFWRTFPRATLRVDLATLATTVLPLAGAAPQSVSRDGRYLLWAGQFGVQSGLWRYDSTTDRQAKVVIDPFIGGGNALSEAGTHALFLSSLTTLVPNDTNAAWDLFLVELPDAPHDKQ